MRIKYFNYVYEVSPLCYIKITLFKACLKIRRVCRWIHFFKIADILLIMFLTVLWSLFGLIFFNLNTDVSVGLIQPLRVGLI